jgi:hypothetical protein
MIDHKCPVFGVVTDLHLQKGLLLLLPFKAIIAAHASDYVRPQDDMLLSERPWWDLLFPASQGGKWVSSGCTINDFPGNAGLWEAKTYSGLQARLSPNLQHPGCPRIGGLVQVLITGIVDSYLVVDEEAFFVQAWRQYIDKLNVGDRINGVVDSVTQAGDGWIVVIGDDSFPATLPKASLGGTHIENEVRIGYLLTNLFVCQKDCTPGKLSVVLGVDDQTAMREGGA